MRKTLIQESIPQTEILMYDNTGCYKIKFNITNIDHIDKGYFKLWSFLKFLIKKHTTGFNLYFL